VPISPADYQKTLAYLSDKQLDVEISYFDRWLRDHPSRSLRRDEYDAKRLLALSEVDRRTDDRIRDNYVKQLRIISLEELETEKYFFTRQLTSSNARIREIAQRRLDTVNAEFALREQAKVLTVPGFSFSIGPFIGPRLRHYLDNYVGTEGHEVDFGWEDLVELREELKSHPALKLSFRSVGGSVLVRIDVDLKEHLKG
jgi:hypothetical protein